MSDARDQSALELQALQRVVASGGRALDLDVVLDRCLEQALAVARAAAGMIYLRDQRNGDHRRALTRNADDELAPERIQLHQDELMPGDHLLLDLRAPLRPGDPSPAVALARGFTHALLLRLRVETNRIGFVALLFTAAPTLAESTLQTLDAIAAFEAVAIKSARAHRQLQLRVRLASTLREFAERVLDADVDTELPTLILETACSISRGDRALLARMYEKQPGETWSRIEHGIGKDAELVGTEMPDSAPYLHEAMARNEPMVVEDASTLDPRSLVGQAAHRHQTASFILITIRQHGRPLGHLFAGSGDPRVYDDAEVEAMQLLSSTAAQALVRAERQAAERAEHARVAAILEHLPLGIAVIDQGGRIIHINAGARAFAERMGSGDPDWRAGMARLEVLDRDGRPLPASEEPLSRAFRGESTHRESTLVSQRGDRIHVVAMAMPLRAPDGRIEAVLTSFQDVTELRELAIAKDRFLSIASHELRSPITSLRATTSLLQIDPASLSDPARRDVLLGRIQRQIDRLTTLIERLLDTTRLSAGELPLELAERDLAALCRDVADGQRLVDRDHSYVIEGDAQVTGRWDAARLEQVITNLLANAGRYSVPGEIVIRVRADGDRARVEIIDRGPGISAEQQGKLFTPFFRGAASSRHKGGLGLGLFISREIVRRHGGVLRLDSAPGRGSTFTVELPRYS
jgi:PAS domain S-box-containing protein